MRYIKKGEEPKTLTEYKKFENAYYDGYKDKDEIKKYLLKEQGYLCGYCMRRLSSVKETKIEHLVPQSKLGDERQALNYKIMVGVCYGNIGKDRKKEQLTCDAHRGNEALTILPFDKTCIDKIKYDMAGRIFSDEKEVNKDLNETLNLNYNGENAYLMLNRKTALEVLKNQLRNYQKKGTWSKALLEKFLQRYEQPDKEGKLIPYSGIAIWYLRKRLR